MKDVALKAAVSTCVVSKVVNGIWRENHISEACAERVQDAVRALDFVPNHVARSLKSGRTGALGLVLAADRANVNSAFSAALILGVESEASERRNDLMLIGPSGALSEAEHGLERLRQRRIDALITPGILGGLCEQRTRAAFIAATGPIVVVFPTFPSAHPGLDVDPAPGVAAAVRHLRGLGHRQILWFAPADEEDAAARSRLAALRATAAECGMQVITERCDLPAVGSWTAVARQRFTEVWRQRRGITAVMCFQDHIALGVCRAAHDIGVRVPSELSVVGFDDFQAEACIPSLTTISHMVPDIGRRAVVLALELAAGGAASVRPGATELVPSRLVLRESTAAPRPADGGAGGAG